MTDDEKKARIRELNDDLRKQLQARNGKISVRGSLMEEVHDGERIRKIMYAIAAFDDFNEENDPHQEHDYGRVSVDGDEFMFKIDYYSLDEAHLSPNPEDPNVTIRVMAVFYSSDY